MRTVAIIQARMGSTRLPGKVLAEAAGKPLLELMTERVRHAALLNDLCVATTDLSEDDAIADLCARLSVPCFRGDGDVNDVLWRVRCAAAEMGAELIVELTGDCPLIDPRIIDRTIHQYHLEPKVDFCSTTRDAAPNLASCYPRGMDVRVFSARILDVVMEATGGPAPWSRSMVPEAKVVSRARCREHVSLYIWEQSQRFSLRHVSPWPLHRSDFRLTVDWPEDLGVVRSIFGAFEDLYPESYFGLETILHFLESNPKLAALNAGIEQKEVHDAYLHHSP